MAEVQRQVISRPSSVLRMTGTIRPESGGKDLSGTVGSSSIKQPSKPASAGTTVARLQPSLKKHPAVEAQRVLAVLDLLIRKVELLGLLQSGGLDLKSLSEEQRNFAKTYLRHQGEYKSALERGDEFLQQSCIESLNKSSRAFFRAATADGSVLNSIQVSLVRDILVPLLIH